MFGRCISLDGAKAKLPQDEDYGMIVFSTEHGKHCEQVRSYIDKYEVCSRLALATRMGVGAVR